MNSGLPSFPFAGRRLKLLKAAGILAVLIASLGAGAAQSTAATKKTRSVRMTLREGTNIAAAVSPRRDRIVIDLQGMLWALPFAGGDAVKLTGFELESTRPRWSPGGDAIAFQLYDGNYHIGMIRPDGSGFRQLTFGPFDDREPAWSPDGKQIAFGSDRGRNRSLDIWTVDVASGDLTRRTTAPTDEYQPAFSPNGREIAFVEDGKAIVAIGQSGERRKLAGVESGRVESPAWKPDGSGVGYVRVEGSASTLMLNDRALTDGEDVFTFAPSWLSDQEILYTADGGIRVRDLSSGAKRAIDFKADLALERPVWEPRRRDFSSTQPQPVKGLVNPRLSPDGQSVVVGALGDLYLIRAGQPPQRLTDDPYFEYDPEWSRDGRSILYTSDKNGSPDVYLRDMRTSAEKRLTTFAGTEYGAALSPDGKALVYLDEEDTVWLLHLGSGEKKKLIEDGHEALGRPTWSPDGKYIAVADLKQINGRFREGYNQLRIINVPSGISRFEDPAAFESISERGDAGPAWSPDGRWMAFIMQSVLWVLPIDADGTPRGVAQRVTSETADSPSWSGDSRQLLYIHQGGLKLVNRDGSGARELPVELTWANEVAKGRTIVHAGSLWDGSSDGTQKDVDIIIDADRIAEIRPHSQERIAGVQYVDASKRTVIPGLFEMHNHPQGHFHRYGTTYWAAFLYLGITENVSMGGYLNEAIASREALASGRTRGPRFFATGETIDGSRQSHSPTRAITSDEHLEKELERQKFLRPDFFKAYVRLSAKHMARVAEVAHESGVPAGSHYLWPGLAAGQDMVSHLSATSRDHSQTVSPAGRSYQDVMEIFTKSGFGIIQTTGGLPLIGQDAALVEDPLIRSVIPEWDIAKLNNMAAKPPTAAQLQRIQQDVGKYAAIVRGGGDLSTGTDAPGSSSPPGVSLHMTLRALVAGGFTPPQALRTVTIDAARMLGVGKDLGTIEPGKLADLAMIDGDPLANINDLIKVKEVMKSGILHRWQDEQRGQ